MNQLRRCLGGIFGFTALILAWPLLFRYRMLIHAGSADPHFAVAASFYLGAILLNGAAAWAVFANRPAARVLGLIASASPALIFFVIAYHYHLPLFRVPWIPVAVAIAGLIAFLPPQSATKDPAPTRIPGDGTSPWIAKAVWIAGAIGFVYGLNWWSHWARLQGLPAESGSFFFLQLLLTDLAVVLIHELGHTVTGLVLGMKLRAFIAGPFQWRKREGAWEFKFQPAGLLATGGATALIPTSLPQPRAEQVCMIAAGPFASLASGVIALSLAISAPGHPWQSVWLFFACVATASLEVGILNLVPFQSGSSYSDGALIYQALAGGPLDDYHRAVSIVSSSLVTSLRPRDYDIDALQRAALQMPHRPSAMMLHLHASSYYLDHGQFSQAGHALTQAESVYSEGAVQMPAELHTAFIFRKALLHRDPAATRIWWDRMESKKPTRFNVDYWRARAALLWIEQKFDEAHPAMEKADALAQRLPEFGAYQFDRYLCGLLRKALDECSFSPRHQ